MKTLSKSTTAAASLLIKSLLGYCRFLKSSRNIEDFLPEGPKNHRVISRITLYRITLLRDFLYIILTDLLAGPKIDHVVSRITLYRDSLCWDSKLARRVTSFVVHPRILETGGGKLLCFLISPSNEVWVVQVIGFRNLKQRNVCIGWWTSKYNSQLVIRFSKDRPKIP